MHKSKILENVRKKPLTLAFLHLLRYGLAVCCAMGLLCAALWACCVLRYGLAVCCAMGLLCAALWACKNSLSNAF